MNSNKTKKGGIKMSYRPIIFLSVLAMLFPAFNLSAEEIEYPVAAYSAEELQNVRTWEKKWVGKKISSAGVKPKVLCHG